MTRKPKPRAGLSVSARKKMIRGHLAAVRQSITKIKELAGFNPGDGWAVPMEFVYEIFGADRAVGKALIEGRKWWK